MTNILTNTLWCTVLLRDLARRESEMTQSAVRRKGWLRDKLPLATVLIQLLFGPRGHHYSCSCSEQAQVPSREQAEGSA